MSLDTVIISSKMGKWHKSVQWDSVLRFLLEFLRLSLFCWSISLDLPGAHSKREESKCNGGDKSIPIVNPAHKFLLLEFSDVNWFSLSFSCQLALVPVTCNWTSTNYCKYTVSTQKSRISLVHSFTQQTLTDHLLCTIHPPRLRLKGWAKQTSWRSWMW